MINNENNPKHRLRQFKALGLSLLFISVLAAIVYLLHFLGYGLAYQHSKSMPEGWYTYYPAHNLKRGDIVLFQPPKSLDNFIAKRGWKKAHEPIMKRVFAMAPDKVCVTGHSLNITHKPKINIKQFDSRGFALPKLQICRALTHNEYMLMSNFNAKSFDSRYFGPINRVNIVAKAKKI